MECHKQPPRAWADFIILRTKGYELLNRLRFVHEESKLKIGVILVFIILLWLGAYGLFGAGFRFLTHLDTAGEDLGGYTLGDFVIVRLFAMLYLVMFFMLIFSNTVLAFSNFYRSEEMRMLITMPVGVPQLYTERMIETIWYSSWAFLFLGSPLIIAYGRTYEVGVVFYVATIIFTALFVCIPAIIGTIIAIFLVWLLPKVPLRLLILIGVLSVVGLFFYVYSSFNVKELEEQPLLPQILATLNTTQSPYLPSYWTAEGILQTSFGAEGQWVGRSLLFGALLLTTMVVLFGVGRSVAGVLFVRGYVQLSDSLSRRRRRQRHGGELIFSFLLRPFTLPIRALTMKDIRLFTREPSQWMQFVLFFGVMAIYIANLRNAPKLREVPQWRLFVSYSNLSTIALILTTLTSRFVFPLISLEGIRFWVIGLAPISKRTLLWQKFWLSFGTSFVFTMSLIVLSDVILQVQKEVFILSCLSILLMNFGFNGIAVGLGAIFPNFREDNPSRIVSGMGGTLNFLLCLLYLILMLAPQIAVLHSFAAFSYQSRGNHLIFVMLAGYLIALSLTATFAPMRLGVRALERADF